MSKPKEFDEIIHCERIGDSLLYNHYVVGEVVRCKDCKYFKTYPPTGDQDYTIYDCERLVYCTDNAVGNLPDDFCSRGERRVDIHNG